MVAQNSWIAIAFFATAWPLLILFPIGASAQTPKKILALHGGDGSPDGFQSSGGMRDLETALPEFEFVYAQGGYSVSGNANSFLWIPDPPGKDNPTTSENIADASIENLNRIIEEEGPFQGILGYSQGAAFVPVYLANIAANSFNFAILFCGYLPTTHLGLLNRIDDQSPFEDIPGLIWIGERDSVIAPSFSRDLIPKFNSPTVVTSPNGDHFVPVSSDPTFDQIVAFVREQVDDDAPTVAPVAPTDVPVETITSNAPTDAPNDPPVTEAPTNTPNDAPVIVDFVLRDSNGNVVCEDLPRNTRFNVIFGEGDDRDTGENNDRKYKFCGSMEGFKSRKLDNWCNADARIRKAVGYEDGLPNGTYVKVYSLCPNSCNACEDTCEDGTKAFIVGEPEVDPDTDRIRRRRCDYLDRRPENTAARLCRNRMATLTGGKKPLEEQCPRTCGLVGVGKCANFLSGVVEETRM